MRGEDQDATACRVLDCIIPVRAAGIRYVALDIVAIQFRKVDPLSSHPAEVTVSPMQYVRALRGCESGERNFKIAVSDGAVLELESHRGASQRGAGANCRSEGKSPQERPWRRHRGTFGPCSKASDLARHTAQVFRPRTAAQAGSHDYLLKHRGCWLPYPSVSI